MRLETLIPVVLCPNMFFLMKTCEEGEASDIFLSRYNLKVASSNNDIGTFIITY
jgi:hypothetical protein